MAALLGDHGELGRVGPVPVLHLALALAELGVEQVAQDGEQPGVEVGAALEPVDVRQGAQQRVLHEVVGAVHLPAERDGAGGGLKAQGAFSGFSPVPRRSRSLLMWVGSGAGASAP